MTELDSVQQEAAGYCQPPLGNVPRYNTASEAFTVLLPRPAQEPLSTGHCIDDTVENVHNPSKELPKNMFKGFLDLSYFR